MHKTLMLQGRYIPKEERFQIRIKGVFGKRLPKKAVVGNSCDVTIRGLCLSSSLKEVPKYLLVPIPTTDSDFGSMLVFVMLVSMFF